MEEDIEITDEELRAAMVTDEPQEEVVPPPVIGEEPEPEVPAEPEAPQMTDEELEQYMLQQVLQKNPQLAQAYYANQGQEPEAEAPPEMPEGLSLEQEIDWRAEQRAKSLYDPQIKAMQDELAAIKAERDQEKFLREADEYAKKHAKEDPEVMAEIFKKAGPAAIQMYEANPDFKALVDDAYAHRSKGKRIADLPEEKAMPSSPTDAGSDARPKYTGDDAELAREFDKHFKDTGISYNEA